MVNYSGRIDWEFFFGVTIARGLQTYKCALQGWKDKMRGLREGRKSLLLGWVRISTPCLPGHGDQAETVAHSATLSATLSANRAENRTI
jgi:hypothetical protein